MRAGRGRARQSPRYVLVVKQEFLSTLASGFVRSHGLLQILKHCSDARIIDLHDSEMDVPKGVWIGGGFRGFARWFHTQDSHPNCHDAEAGGSTLSHTTALPLPNCVKCSGSPAVAPPAGEKPETVASPLPPPRRPRRRRGGSTFSGCTDLEPPGESVGRGGILHILNERLSLLILEKNPNVYHIR